MEEPSLKELLNSLNIMTRDNVDHRWKILILQLYSEHYINEILMHMVNERSIGKEVKEEISFTKKIAILERVKIIKHDVTRVLSVLNDLRRTMVHSLVIDDKIIRDKLKSRELGFNYEVNFHKDGEEVTGINLKEMYKEASATEYAQFDVSAMLVVGVLYLRLQVIRKQEVKYILLPELEKKTDGSFIINVTVSERAINQKLAEENNEDNLGELPED